MLTFGSLFAGIGGLDLGLERAGLKCKWQVEIDPVARQVLETHWPKVHRWDDVRTFPPRPIEEWSVDVIAGGFPCQPVSSAGKRKGRRDVRWMWPDFIRVVREIGPKIVVGENVAGLLSIDAGRLFGTVLRDLAKSGFDVEWESLPAASFGAPHIRDRVFFVAYRRGEQRQPKNRLRPGRSIAGSDVHSPVANAAGPRNGLLPARRGQAGIGTAVADRDCEGVALRSASDAERWRLEGRVFGRSEPPANQFAADRRTTLGTAVGEAWAPEPGEAWVDDGISGGMAEVCSRLFGNAVVPQVAEWIGRRIVAACEQ